MRRGDLVTIAVQGDFGKPRPALVIQSDSFNRDHSTIVVLPITNRIVEAPLFRITLKPDAQNGLKKESQIMIDKIMVVKKEKIGPAFGHVGDRVLLEASLSMAVFLGMA